MPNVVFNDLTFEVVCFTVEMLLQLMMLKMMVAVDVVGFVWIPCVFCAGIFTKCLYGLKFEASVIVFYFCHNVLLLLLFLVFASSKKAARNIQHCRDAIKESDDGVLVVAY